MAFWDKKPPVESLGALIEHEERPKLAKEQAKEEFPKFGQIVDRWARRSELKAEARLRSYGRNSLTPEWYKGERGPDAKKAIAAAPVEARRAIAAPDKKDAEPLEPKALAVMNNVREITEATERKTAGAAEKLRLVFQSIKEYNALATKDGMPKLKKPKFKSGFFDEMAA